MDLNDIDSIKPFIKGKYSTLLLFGSYSRGDNNIDSDIDILQITDNYFPSYSINHYNISVYTLSQLINMAEEGSLFILHLINEAKVIYGDEKIIFLLRTKFRAPANYSAYRNELILTADVLDIDVNTYNKNWKGFNNLLSYLFRSYLYSLLFDENKIVFSINSIALYFHDNDIILFFRLKKMNHGNYNEFENCKKIFEKYTGRRIYNPYKNPRTLLDNMKMKSKLMTALSLHFIKDEVADPDYL